MNTLCKSSLKIRVIFCLEHQMPSLFTRLIYVRYARYYVLWKTSQGRADFYCEIIYNAEVNWKVPRDVQSEEICGKNTSNRWIIAYLPWYSITLCQSANSWRVIRQYSLATVSDPVVPSDNVTFSFSMHLQSIRLRNYHLQYSAHSFSWKMYTSRVHYSKSVRATLKSSIWLSCHIKQWGWTLGMVFVISSSTLLNNHRQ